MNDWRLLPGSNVAHLWREADDGVIYIALCNRVRYCVSETATVRMAAMPGAKRCRACERKARAQ